MTDPQKRKWFWIAVFSSVVFAIIFFFPVVYHSGQIIPQLGRDSIKNVYTYLYQVTYGSGIWFKGMGYPWGDNIAYSDCQMLYSLILSSFKNRVSPEFAMGFMWSCILISFSMCMVYVYCILDYFKIKPILAIIFAAFITFMSPQVLRTWGHYGLSYAFVIPFLFYYTLLYHNEQSRHRYKYLVYFAILFAYMYFIHMYFVLIISVWTGLYCLGYFLLEKYSFRKKIFHIVPMMVGLALMVGLGMIFLKVNDHIKDRPTLPWGTLAYVTHPKEIFTSVFSPFWKSFDTKKDGSFIHLGDDGMIYLGLVTIICTLVSALLVAKKLLVKKTTVTVPGLPKIWILMGVVTLAIGMGMPFIFRMEFLLDYLSYIRQFRCLGRVSWIFYYIISINTAIYIGTKYSNLVRNQRKNIAVGLLSLVILVWGTEVYGFYSHEQEILKEGNNNYNHFLSKNEKGWAEFLKERQLKGSDFQAAIIFPYAEIGNEKLTVGFDPKTDSFSNAIGFKVSYQLNMPLLNTNMSRTSWAQAFSRIKLIGGPFTDKAILDSLPNSKPLLLLVFDDWTADPDYQFLIQQSDSIGHFLNCSVYKLPIEKLKKSYIDLTGKIKEQTANMAVRDTCVTYGGPWLVKHFDSKESPIKFLENGVSSVQKKNSDTVFRGDLIGPIIDTNYEISIWTLATPNDYKFASLNITTFDTAGNLLSFNEIFACKATDNEGLWLRANKYFIMPRNAHHVEVIAWEVSGEHRYVSIDEILLRPVSGIIVSKDKQKRTMINNHLIKK